MAINHWFPCQGKEIMVLPIQALICFCRKTWHKSCSALKASFWYQCSANRCRTPAPHYSRSNKVWLSTTVVPLKTDAKKLSPWFVSPFCIEKINPMVIFSFYLAHMCHTQNLYPPVHWFLLFGPLHPPRSLATPICEFFFYMCNPVKNPYS